MPQIHYPFIDIAVHPAIRTKFAAGEAIALFSRDMSQVLWANGEGAKLFGYSDIYDLLDNGPEQAGIAFRQLAATARQLQTIGDRRGLMMRIASGFSSQAISAEVSLVEIRSGDVVVIFSAPIAANATFDARIASMLKGFDDPDTHMAIIDDQGAVFAASPGFDALGILPETSRSLISVAAKSDEGLIKRPIASSAGYLPAAIGRLSVNPPLNLLFCVETVLGRMDPPQQEPVAVAAEPSDSAAIEAANTVAVPEDSEGTPSFADIDQPFTDAEHHLAETIEPPLAEPIEHNEPSSLQDDVTTAVQTFHDLQDHQDVAVQDTPAVVDLAAAADPIFQHIETGETSIAADLTEEILAPADIVESAPHLEQQAELLTEEVEAQTTPESDDQVMSEYVRAENSEVELNETDSVEDLSDLAALDGASESDIAEVQPDEGEPEMDVGAPDDMSIDDGKTIGTVALDEPVHEHAASEDQPDIGLMETTETHSAEEHTSDDMFSFKADGRPVRFVWKLDAHGRFAEVSDEFARTVGPRAGDINGMAFRDLDSLFHLDPTKEISDLLERRDTWSGRTIRWPVEGTDLVVPVDLAALPTYSRNREFDGFRGFGIIRVSDAERDPHAVGRTLALPNEGNTSFGTLHTEELAQETRRIDEFAQSQSPAEVESPVEAVVEDDVPLTVDGQFDDLHAEDKTPEHPPVWFSQPETIDIDSIPELPDDFRGEVPALKTDTRTPSTFSEKIIQLEERRARGRDGLSPTEQNAFREIARQLEPFGKRPNETLFEQQAASPADEAVADKRKSTETETAGDVAHAELDPIELMSQTASNADAGGAHDDAITDEAARYQQHADDDGEPEDKPEPVGNVGLTAAGADQMPVPILIHAGDRLIYANTEFMRFTGYSSLAALEAVGGLDALIIRHEGADAGVYATRGDGTQIPISARLQSVRFEGAKLLMLTMALADPAPPTEDFAEDHEAARKLASLKVEADELRSILETATDGVVVLDTEGRIRSMNRSANALFNFEDSETRGKPFAMLFAHESQKAVQDYLSGLAGHGVATVLNDGREVIGREASGGFLPLFMTMGRMPGSNSYCAVMRDITQWKRSEEELKAAKRAAETANQHKSDFLARVSHEIRTPLNAIIGFSDMIASEHFGPAGHARYVEYANDIGRSGRHVLDIVNDLLDISKIEAGEMDLEFAAVGINECVSEAVSLVQPQANTQRVIIRTSLSQSVPDVVADLRSIKQIAINILANAIRFTPSGGQIVVSTAYETNGSVTLRIRDTGVGMSKSELDQAMKPFGQVHPGTRQRGDGTGLGLPLTRAMTEANRATFSIQSAPNEGTLVEIIFPPQRVLAD